VFPFEQPLMVITCEKIVSNRQAVRIAKLPYAEMSDITKSKFDNLHCTGRNNTDHGVIGGTALSNQWSFEETNDSFIYNFISYVNCSLNPNVRIHINGKYSARLISYRYIDKHEEILLKYIVNEEDFPLDRQLRKLKQYWDIGPSSLLKTFKWDEKQLVSVQPVIV